MHIVNGVSVDCIGKEQQHYSQHNPVETRLWRHQSWCYMNVTFMFLSNNCLCVFYSFLWLPSLIREYEARKGEKEWGNGTATTSLFSYIFLAIFGIWHERNPPLPSFCTSTSVFLLFTQQLFHTSFPDLVSLISFSRLANKWKWLGLARLGLLHTGPGHVVGLPRALPVSLFLKLDWYYNSMVKILTNSRGLWLIHPFCLALLPLR
jgi:hypothetical protein